MTDKQKSCAQDRTIKEIFFRTDGRLNRWRYFTRRVIVSIVTKIFLFIGYKILGYEYEQVTTAATVYNSAVSIIFLLPIYCTSRHESKQNACGCLCNFKCHNGSCVF